MKFDMLLPSILWGEDGKTQYAALRSLAKLYGISINEVIKQSTEVVINMHVQNRLDGETRLQDEVFESGAKLNGLSQKASRLLNTTNAILEESEGLLALIASERK